MSYSVLRKVHLNGDSVVPGNLTSCGRIAAPQWLTFPAQSSFVLLERIFRISSVVASWLLLVHLRPLVASVGLDLVMSRHLNRVLLHHRVGNASMDHLLLSDFLTFEIAWRVISAGLLGPLGSLLSSGCSSPFLSLLSLLSESFPGEKRVPHVDTIAAAS